MDADLVHQVADVGPDGSVGDPHVTGNLTVVEAGDQQVQDLLLAGGQVGKKATTRDGSGFQQTLVAGKRDEPVGGHEHLTASGTADRASHLGRRYRLGEIGTGAGLDGGQHRVVAVVGAEEDDRDLGPQPPNPGGRLRPGTVGQARVHQYDV